MKWKLHYQDKLRSTQIGSALFFGNAIDEALNRLLLEKKKELNDDEKSLMEQTPLEVFKDKMEKVYIIDEFVDIAQSAQAEYYKSDLDLDLLEARDFSNIIGFAETQGITLEAPMYVREFVEEAQIEMKKGLDESTQRVYNYCCWLSLFRKGIMMIEAYKTQIMPQIEEVYEVQKKVSLPDGDDEFVGIVDLICSFNDEPGVKYVCDNKTSSRAYKEDSVRISEQLAAYSEAENNGRCAYIVVEKKIRKREPRVRCSIIKDTILDTTLDETFDNLTKVFHGVQAKEFDKDLDNCFSYGRKCQYYDFCRTEDKTNLKYMEKKNGDKQNKS